MPENGKHLQPEGEEALRKQREAQLRDLGPEPDEQDAVRAGGVNRLVVGYEDEGSGSP